MEKTGSTNKTNKMVQYVISVKKIVEVFTNQIKQLYNQLTKQRVKDRQIHRVIEDSSSGRIQF